MREMERRGEEGGRVAYGLRVAMGEVDRDGASDGLAIEDLQKYN
jgi:hypothetical protein